MRSDTNARSGLSNVASSSMWLVAALLGSTVAVRAQTAAPPAIDPALVANPGAVIFGKIQPNTLTAADDPTFATGLFASSRSTLLGDAFGLRSGLGAMVFRSP